jgi:hypothetical protein
MKNQVKSNSIRRNANICKAMGIIAFVMFSGSVFCQAPMLGTSSAYAVFTAVGEFNNLDGTIIVGDAGTNVGAFNGFPPGDVQGQINVADARSAQAAIDVDNAYSDLLAVECGVVLGTTMGSGQILTPAVYCLGAASTLNGDLTFDAQGNKDAIFIVKIDGAFATGTFANVILINSASACNIYWQVNGQFTLGENAVFKGNVITEGAIILLKAATIDGRLLSRAGAVSLDSNNVTLICDEVILPVELTSFVAECLDQQAIICWNTASEINNRDFTLECSADGTYWETLGILNGAGNLSTSSHYSFIHDNPYPLTSYYRLKQTDFDQNLNYSPIISLENCETKLVELSVYPNPVTNTLFLNFTGDHDKSISIAVYNSFGQMVYSSDVYQSQLDLSDKSSGIYFLHFYYSGHRIIKRIIIASDKYI